MTPHSHTVYLSAATYPGEGGVPRVGARVYLSSSIGQQPERNVSGEDIYLAATNLSYGYMMQIQQSQSTYASSSETNCSLGRDEEVTDLTCGPIPGHSLCCLRGPYPGHKSKAVFPFISCPQTIPLLFPCWDSLLESIGLKG